MGSVKQNRLARCAGFVLIAILWVAPSIPAAAPPVSRLTVPNQGICPDGAVSAKGTIEEVYARNSNAFFVQSDDGGHTFSKPVRLNRVAGSVLAGHERGPKIAMTANGALHVIWMDTKSQDLEYTRRPPHETSFTAPVNLRAPGAHLDGAAIAAEERHRILIAWLDSRLPEDPRNPLSLPIFVRWSQDDGKDFIPSRPLGSGSLLRACSCCSLHAVASGADVFDVAFRGAYANIRDPWLAKVQVAAKPPVAQAAWVRTQAARVADQRWNFPGCPMAGPSIARGPKPHQIWVAWYSNGRVFYAHSFDGGAHFSAPSSPAANGKQPQNHPVIVVNQSGSVLLAWEEGQDVYWQLLGNNGKVKSSGRAGTLPPNSKAAAFADAHGKFFLVF